MYFSKRALCPHLLDVFIPPTGGVAQFCSKRKCYKGLDSGSLPNGVMVKTLTSLTVVLARLMINMA